MPKFIYSRKDAYKYLLKNFNDLLLSSTVSDEMIELIKFSELFVTELSRNINNYKNNSLYRNTNITYKEHLINCNYDKLKKHKKFLDFLSNKLLTKSKGNYIILSNEINKFLVLLRNNNDFINEFDRILSKPKDKTFDSKLDEFESKILMFYIDNFQEKIIDNGGKNCLLSSLECESILSNISNYGNGTEHSFLSYAYNDRLFTVSLYLFFLKEMNIELYIDWMRNSKIIDGKILKNSLLCQLKKSDNLYLLRSPYSEYFNGENLRDFCAWETGCYTSIINSEINTQKKLYLINTINSFHNNIFYDDFQLIGDVLNNFTIKKRYLK